MNKYNIRPLQLDDYHRGFLQLLERLTTVGDITYEQFALRFNNSDSNTTTYVIEDTNKLIATGTLITEKKYIHNLSSVGHIEDIVVSADYGGQGLGRLIVTHLTQIAKDNRCYKVILNCNKDNIGFYNKCGFIEKEVEMVKYFDK